MTKLLKKVDYRYHITVRRRDVYYRSSAGEEILVKDMKTPHLSTVYKQKLKDLNTARMRLERLPDNIGLLRKVALLAPLVEALRQELSTRKYWGEL